jgi:hypothetical protein
MSPLSYAAYQDLRNNPSKKLFQVLNYQEKLLQSGDADMCYYNFLCSIPVMNVIDFNHIFSNIGYLFFGSLFLFLTAYKVRNRYLKSHIAKCLFVAVLQ